MGASLLVFKNKSDVPGAMSVDDIRRVTTAPPKTRGILTWLQGLELDNIHTHRWNVVTCSAVTGEGLKEGVDWVVQDAKNRLFLF